MRVPGFLAALTVLLFPSFLTLAAELHGEAVGISDGHTLTLLTVTRQQVRVRLAESDAPESRQPWGSRAQQALSALVFRKRWWWRCRTPTATATPSARCRSAGSTPMPR
jgi:endonuclease YncB( thermonuclease family)